MLTDVCNQTETANYQQTLACDAVAGNRSFAERQKVEATAASSTGKPSEDNECIAGGIMMLNGALINVDNVVSNMNKSEKARVELEAKLKTLEEKYGTLNSAVHSFDVTNI